MYDSLTTLIFGITHSDTAYLLNDYPVEFEIEDKKYHCVKQYLMYRQAEVCEDLEAAKAVLDSTKPKELSNIAISCSQDIEYKWLVIRSQVLLSGISAKFSQNLHLDTMLRHTPHNLVFASVDTFLGVGLDYEDPNLQYPKIWVGQNMLGYTLMYVRTLLLEDKITMLKKLGYLK